MLKVSVQLTVMEFNFLNHSSAKFLKTNCLTDKFAYILISKIKTRNQQNKNQGKPRQEHTILYLIIFKIIFKMSRIVSLFENIKLDLTFLKKRF